MGFDGTDPCYVILAIMDGSDISDQVGGFDFSRLKYLISSKPLLRQFVLQLISYGRAQCQVARGIADRLTHHAVEGPEKAVKSIAESDGSCVRNGICHHGVDYNHSSLWLRALQRGPGCGSSTHVRTDVYIQVGDLLVTEARFILTTHIPFPGRQIQLDRHSFSALFCLSLFVLSL